MKKYGRAFNHIEDLTFFYGSDGAREALTHLQEVCQSPGELRLKWDGGCQVYWGRDDDNTFNMASHNSWSRGVQTTTPDALYNFITKESGKPSPARNKFAKQYVTLFDKLKNITPDVPGYYYADVLFMEPVVENLGYHLYPNNKSGYHIPSNSKLGRLMPNLEALLVCHGRFDEFGEADEDQVPFDFELKQAPLAILKSHYNQILPSVDLSVLESLILKNSDSIDLLLRPIDGVSNYKNCFYQYLNHKAKTYSLNTVGTDFIKWIENDSKLSHIQKSKVLMRVSHVGAKPLFDVVKCIIQTKDNITSQLETWVDDICITNPEGWVKYADESKQFGNVKFIPRNSWLP